MGNFELTGVDFQISDDDVGKKQGVTEREYNQLNNPICITKYPLLQQIKEFVLKPTKVLMMIDKARKLVGDNKNHQPFIMSLISDNYNQALRRACVAGRIDLVKLLIDNNEAANLNLDFTAETSKHETPLDLAVRSGNNELICLIKERLQFNDCGVKKFGKH